MMIHFMTITNPGKSRVLGSKCHNCWHLSVYGLGNELWNQVRKNKNRFIGLGGSEHFWHFVLLDWTFFDILNGKIKIFNFLAATDFGNLQRTNLLICSTIDTKTPIIMMDLVMSKIGKFWSNWRLRVVCTAIPRHGHTPPWSHRNAWVIVEF